MFVSHLALRCWHCLGISSGNGVARHWPWSAVSMFSNAWGKAGGEHEVHYLGRNDDDDAWLWIPGIGTGREADGRADASTRSVLTALVSDLSRLSRLRRQSQTGPRGYTALAELCQKIEPSHPRECSKHRQNAAREWNTARDMRSSWQPIPWPSSSSYEVNWNRAVVCANMLSFRWQY
jgi:hypothetical protein